MPIPRDRDDDLAARLTASAEARITARIQAAADTRTQHARQRAQLDQARAHGLRHRLAARADRAQTTQHPAA